MTLKFALITVQIFFKSRLKRVWTFLVWKILLRLNLSLAEVWRFGERFYWGYLSRRGLNMWWEILLRLSLFEHLNIWCEDFIEVISLWTFEHLNIFGVRILLRLSLFEHLNIWWEIFLRLSLFEHLNIFGVKILLRLSLSSSLFSFKGNILPWFKITSSVKNILTENVEKSNVLTFLLRSVFSIYFLYFLFSAPPYVHISWSEREPL